jgi:hypothetical protein
VPVRLAQEPVLPEPVQGPAQHRLALVRAPPARVPVRLAQEPGQPGRVRVPRVLVLARLEPEPTLPELPAWKPPAREAAGCCPYRSSQHNR